MSTTYNSIHSRFITTPLIKILDDGVRATATVGRGMETHTLLEYLLQSIFLRITGAQEQKLKCICWEMATNDYDFRYKYLDKAKSDYGEFSKYEQKNKVYTELLTQIRHLDKTYSIDKTRWLPDLTHA